MSSLTFLKEVVEPALFQDLPAAFQEFGWERTDRGWRATNRAFTKERFGCRPARVVCQQPRGFYIHGETPYGVSWVEYVSEEKVPVEDRFRDVVRELARKARVDPSPLDRPLGPEERERQERVRRNESVREAAFAVFKQMLRSEKGRQARRYLHKERGIGTTDLKTLEVGYYPANPKALQEELLSKGFSIEQMEDAGVLYRPFAGRIIGAWKDRSGRIGDFWARSIGKDEERKYLRLPREHATRDEELVAYGLDVALACREGREDLVLVEGVWDAALLQARGFLNVAAVGAMGNKLSAERWQKLRSWGVLKATLVFDNDRGDDGAWPGLKGTLSAIENSLKAEKVPEVYVLDPVELGEHKDPDELIRAAPEGLEVFREILGRRRPALRFQAEEILRRHQTSSKWTAEDRKRAIDDAMQLVESVLRVNPERATELDFYVWKPVIEGTGADEDLLRTRLEVVRERAAREREKQAQVEAFEHERQVYGTVLEESRRLLDEGDLEKTKELLRTQVERLRLDEEHRDCEALRSIAQELPDNRAELELWRGAEFIGLRQRTLPKLDWATRGLRGLMLLAAAPNTGKTALGVQFGLDAARHDPEACFVFVSLEMTRQSLISRMKCRLAHMDWQTLVFGSQKEKGRGQEAFFTAKELGVLEETEEQLTEVGKRIYILDEGNFPNPTTGKILAEIERIKEETGAKRALVLIDYLQVWPIPPDAGGSIRVENDADKWRIGEMKSLRDRSNGDAILVISEARKPSGQASESWGGALADVMGSARGSYTPDMVFLLRPWSDLELGEHFKCVQYDQAGRGRVDKDKLAKGKLALAKSGRSLCKLIIAKGRDGVLRDSLDLTFWYRQTRFEEGVTG